MGEIKEEADSSAAERKKRDTTRSKDGISHTEQTTKSGRDPKANLRRLLYREGEPARPGGQTKRRPKGIELGAHTDEG